MADDTLWGRLKTRPRVILLLVVFLAGVLAVVLWPRSSILDKAMALPIYGGYTDFTWYSSNQIFVIHQVSSNRRQASLINPYTGAKTNLSALDSFLEGHSNRTNIFLWKLSPNRQALLLLTGDVTNCVRKVISLDGKLVNQWPIEPMPADFIWGSDSRFWIESDSNLRARKTFQLDQTNSITNSSSLSPGSWLVAASSPEALCAFSTYGSTNILHTPAKARLQLALPPRTLMFQPAVNHHADEAIFCLVRPKNLSKVVSRRKFPYFKLQTQYEVGLTFVSLADGQVNNTLWFTRPSQCFKPEYIPGTGLISFIYDEKLWVVPRSAAGR